MTSHETLLVFRSLTTRIASVCLAVLLLNIGIDNGVEAQDTKEAKTEAAKDIPELTFNVTFSGAANDEMPEMKKLLGLKLEDEMLLLRRDWDDVKDKWADRWPRREPFNQRVIRERPKPKGVGLAFRNVGIALGCGGYSGSPAAHPPRMNCSGQSHFCSINGNHNGLRFVFGRSEAPLEMFMLEELEDGQLTINFSRGADIVQILQNIDKTAHIAYIIDGKPGKIAAKSFAELFHTETIAMERVVGPLLNHMGIGVPLHYGSNEVREYVAQRLISNKSTSAAEFEELVKGLSAPRFEAREYATEMLKGGVGIWKEKMNAYVDDKSNPIEPRMRLKQIIETSELSESSTIVQFVASHDLLKSQDYLFSLLPEASEELHDAVFLQLEKTNPDKDRSKLEKEYRDWLKKSGR